MGYSGDSRSRCWFRRLVPLTLGTPAAQFKKNVNNHIFKGKVTRTKKIKQRHVIIYEIHLLNLVNGSSKYMSISHPSRYILKNSITYYHTTYCQSGNDKQVYKTKHIPLTSEAGLVKCMTGYYFLAWNLYLHLITPSSWTAA